ncbi:MAG: 2-amino-4-hydroxy-6-hydroxymethyldihydropteridine diphosphokinase [Chitinophagales bacterium]
MNKVYLLIGGNLEARFLNLKKARILIGQKIGEVLQVSSIYETSAWGVEDQPDFLNQVVMVLTTLEPLDLLATIHLIEEELERKRIQKWGARTMDIDILFYENQIIETPNLTIPHARLHLRRFTLVPLCELFPDFVHPVLQKNLLNLLLDCEDVLAVKRIQPNKKGKA